MMMDKMERPNFKYFQWNAKVLKKVLPSLALKPTNQIYPITNNHLDIVVNH